MSIIALCVIGNNDKEVLYSENQLIVGNKRGSSDQWIEKLKPIVLLSTTELSQSHLPQALSQRMTLSKAPVQQ